MMTASEIIKNILLLYRDADEQDEGANISPEMENNIEASYTILDNIFKKD